MTIRDTLNAKPIIPATVAGVLLITALVIAFFSLRSTNPAAQAQVVLKCTNCGQSTRQTLEWVQQHTTKLTIDPAYPGAPCPSCSQDALASAYECPADHVVFTAKAIPTPTRPRTGAEVPGTSAKCPTCGWDPQAARREQLDRLMK